MPRVQARWPRADGHDADCVNCLVTAQMRRRHGRRRVRVQQQALGARIDRTRQSLLVRVPARLHAAAWPLPAVYTASSMPRRLEGRRARTRDAWTPGTRMRRKRGQALHLVSALTEDRACSSASACLSPRTPIDHCMPMGLLPSYSFHNVRRPTQPYSLWSLSSKHKFLRQNT
eukprot:366465-Chlamydomonas_euryale.AAC.1